jgi:O-acetyl-ADP-ribose deacetylase (regulator of RNase III)
VPAPARAGADQTCFVIMPYGKKPDADGTMINFDRIYEDFIQATVDGIPGVREGIPGLTCDRAIDLNKPGWIHEQMLRHILNDAVAIVDTSTLNANVFYELGVRHAVRKSLTILVHRQGTPWPFNIEGMSSLEYSTREPQLTRARDKLREWIVNGLKDPENVDSLVFKAVPELRVERSRAKIFTHVETFEFPLVSKPSRRIGLVTGDYGDIRVADAWVNSENTDMQMDRYFGTSTSATIRYLGAEKDPATGNIREDTIGKAIAALMGPQQSVQPAAVLATDSGALRSNGVKLLLHVASVVGQPREGYKPIDRIERCVTGALARVDANFRDRGIASVMFPLLGTGPAGGDLQDHAERLIGAAVDYLDSHPDTVFSVVYFYIWNDVAMEICRRVIGRHANLQPLAARGHQ